MAAKQDKKPKRMKEEDENKLFDSQFRSILGDAREDVPGQVWLGIEQRLSAMEAALTTFKQELTGKIEETSQAFSALKATLDKTESFSQPRRTKASGGGGDELLTDC